MRHIFLFLVGTLAMFTSLSAHARIIHYGSEPETITVSYGGPTILRFDQEVRTISQAHRFNIVPVDSEKPDYNTLSVTPRFTRGKADVVFILANGKVVNTKIIIVSSKLPERVDSFYDFRPKDELLEQLDSHKDERKVSELELMKSMLRTENIIGYKLRKLVRTVRVNNKDLEIKLIRVYTGAQFNGYVFRINNTSEFRTYSVDVKALSLGSPNMAIMAQIDRNLLHPSKKKGHSTYLRIVAKPASIYYQMRLPFEKVPSKSK